MASTSDHWPAKREGYGHYSPKVQELTRALADAFDRYREVISDRSITKQCRAPIIASAYDKVVEQWNLLAQARREETGTALYLSRDQYVNVTGSRDSPPLS